MDYPVIVSDGVGLNGETSVFGAGMFWDTVDFAPPPATEEHTSNGLADAFVVKYFQDGSW